MQSVFVFFFDLRESHNLFVCCRFVVPASIFSTYFFFNKNKQQDPNGSLDFRKMLKTS